MVNELLTNMENKTIDKRTAVTLLGNDTQQKHFEKYGRFNNKTIEDSLIKTIEQYYESVEKVKVGRAVHYKLGAARAQIEERKDNRVSNGGKELAYTKYLDAMILMAFDSKLFTKHEATLNEWVWNFGLVNEALYSLKTNRLGAQGLKEVLGECEVSLGAIELTEFKKDFDTKKNVLKRVLTKMDAENMIDFYKVPKAKLVTPIIHPNGNKESIVTLDTDMVDKVNEFQRKWIEFYGVTPYELQMDNRDRLSPQAKEKLKSYESKLREFYEKEITVMMNGEERHVQVDYIWFNYAISVKATKSKIRKYVQKYRPDFYDEYVTNQELFFNSSQDNFAAERRKVVLQKAYKKAESMYEELLQEDKKLRESNKRFGRVPPEERRLRQYWKSHYVESVGKLEVHLKEDFDQKLKNTKRD